MRDLKQSFMFFNVPQGSCFLSLILLVAWGYGILSPPMVSGTEQDDSIIINADDIREMNAHKMADVLNHVPGVSASDSSATIHGSSKVKVFVDGRPINDPTSAYGAVKWELVTPAEVESIEILRGKGGMRYGQDASGGVILITTKRVKKLTGNVKAYGGSDDTGYGYGSVRMTSGNWLVGVTGGYETTESHKINNDKECYQAGGKLGYTFDDEKKMLFMADHIEEKRGSSGLPDHPTPHYRKSSENTNLSLQASLKKIRSSSFYNDGKNHNTDPDRKADPESDKGLDQRLHVTEWGEDLSGTVTNRFGEMNIGGSYTAGLAKGTTFDNQDENTVSAFISQSFKFPSKPFTFGIGVRANINSAFDDAVNPEIKATYKKAKWRVSTAYSRTNNTPSFYQRFNRTSSTEPNPDLEMETSDNYNLAFSVSPFNSVTCSMSLFHNRLNDRITYVTGDDGIGKYENFGLVTYTGTDLSFSLQAHKSIRIKGSYTYMEAKDDETGLWLTCKARHKADLDLHWKPYEPVSIVLSSKYVSKIYRNKANTTSVPEYTLTDFRAEYGFRRFSLFCEIENIFDKTYYFSDGLLAPPRTWIAGMNWQI